MRDVYKHFWLNQPWGEEVFRGRIAPEIRPCWKTLLYLHTLAGEKLIGGSVLPFFQVMCDQRESEVHRAWQHMLHKEEMFTNSYLQHSVSPLPVSVEMVKRYWVSASQWSRAPQLLMPNVSLWRSTDNQWDRKMCPPLPPLKPHDYTALISALVQEQWTDHGSALEIMDRTWPYLM